MKPLKDPLFMIYYYDCSSSEIFPCDLLVQEVCKKEGSIVNDQEPTINTDMRKKVNGCFLI